jgi:hypothetical protein
VAKFLDSISRSIGTTSPFHSLLDFDISVIVQIKWKLQFVFSKFCRVSKKSASSGTPIGIEKIQLVREAIVMCLPHDAE